MKRLTALLVIILVVVGATLAYADTTGMIGKTVDQVYPVYVNGQQLSTEAISIDGTSYIPTRAVSNALSATVSFQNGQIDVTSGTTATSGATQSTTSTTDNSIPQALLAATLTFTDLDIPTKSHCCAEVINGQWYISKATFGQYFNSQTEVIALPNGKSVIIPQGKGMVNLADLGLTATAVYNNMSDGISDNVILTIQ